ncbi:MAG: heme exporter protein CcmD [Rhizomicrobium sp.]|jgi:heme exporter protein CcmD
MSDFIAQGGYGAYVWSAYGVSLLGLGAVTFFTLSAYRKAKRALARLQLSETNI